MLTLTNVTKKFGELVAVKNLSFKVEKGRIFGIAGPNGAGKSTVFNLISGFFPFQGKISFNGRSISGLPPHRIARAGIARTFQSPKSFTSMTVWENAAVGQRFGNRKNSDPAWLEDILRFMGLDEKRDLPTDTLNLLDRKKLMMAAALATGPRLLMLDEPMAGSNTSEIRQLMDLILAINRDLGISILIIEHFMKVLTELTEELLIIESGEKIARGDPEEVTNDPGSAKYIWERQMLKVTDLHAYYDHFHVLEDININVGAGEVVVILGPNGHGKSTLLKAICGLVERVEGRIDYQGRNILGLRADKTVNMGITYIAENRELFPRLTVLENLKLGAYSKNARPHEKENLERVFELFPRLVERQAQMADTLSGGEARMLAVARGLMSNADLLCIDEPSLGLQPSLRHEVFNIIREINRQGKTVLLVEQNIPRIMELAHRFYVLEEGGITFDGDRNEVLKNEHLKEIFLGM